MTAALKTAALFALAALVPVLSFAAEIRTSPDPGAIQSENFSVHVEVVAGSESLNVVEGAVAIPEGMHVAGISTAGTAFPLWTFGPSYAVIEREVRFTGGSLQSVAPGTSAHLFTIMVRADRAGTYSFESDAEAYANDGKGTRVVLDARATSVTVGDAKNERTKPAGSSKLVAEIGSDPSLFDGAWFVAFYGGDEGNGVAYYEIREGDNEPIRADRLYLIKDQSLESKIRVTAVAPDGTRTTITLGTHAYWPYLLCLILFLGLGYFLYRRFRS